MFVAQIFTIYGFAVNLKTKTPAICWGWYVAANALL
jgi:hypothetical protein